MPPTHAVDDMSGQAYLTAMNARVFITKLITGFPFGTGVRVI